MTVVGLITGHQQESPRGKLYLAVLLMLWSFMAIILNNAYTGKIVSNLLVPERKPIVRSLEELSHSSLDWIVRHGSARESLFKVTLFFTINVLSNVNSIPILIVNNWICIDKKAENGVYRLIGEGILRNPNLMNLPEDEMINLVASGKHAIIDVEYTSINSFNTNRLCFSVIHDASKLRVTTRRNTTNVNGLW